MNYYIMVLEVLKKVKDEHSISNAEHADNGVPEEKRVAAGDDNLRRSRIATK